ncbi:MAG: hypothetical protein K2H19_07360, partial [Ruminococcus sp.]|nr:hypothetical protein [Ruminococcus sp.]
MKKLTSLFTSAVVLAASATPIIGNAEYNISESRYWPGEKTMFAKMDSGEFDVDIDGNGVVDALDGYLLECYEHDKGSSIDLGINMSEEIKERIKAIADYNEDGVINYNDVDSWVRYFIVKRNLKVELFNPDYYVSEYVSSDSDYISYVQNAFMGNLYQQSYYLQAGYDIVAEMYENGIINLDFNGNGQLDIGDAYEFYVYHNLSGYRRLDNIHTVICEENTYIPDEDFNRCDEAYQMCRSIISNGFDRDLFTRYTTYYIVGHIELKSEYFTEEYYQDTYGDKYYCAYSHIISSRVRDAAADLGLEPDKDAWIKYNIDDLNEFFECYCNDVENGLRPAPDVNMDGVVDIK